MADYYSLLTRAIAALPQPTREARQGVYERARKALFNQLRGIQPPVAEDDILAEGRALDDAVARVESEAAAKSNPASNPAPAAPSRTAPVAQEPRKAPIPPFLTPRPAPARPAAPPPLPASRAAPTGAPDKSSFFAGRKDEPKPVDEAPPAAADTRAKAPEPPRARAPAPPPPSQAAPASEPPREQPLQQRPAAPLPRMPEPPSGSRRLLAILAILIIFVGVVALAAWHFRERPEDLAKLKPDDSGSESVETGKFAERVEGGESATAGGKSSPRGGPALPVAQKAELWVASAQEPNKVDKIYSGSVIWRFDNVGGGSGEPVSPAVRGEVDIPDAKMKLTLVFQKNQDATVSFSHTVNVSFAVAPTSDLKGVKAIGPIQMRRPEAQTGEKLVGVPVPITENNFLIGMMRGDREARNLYLLRSNMVLDLPMQLNDGRAATINMEKGPSGERAFADALDAWGQPKQR